MQTRSLRFLAIFAASVAASATFAQTIVSYSVHGSTYSRNFDDLATTSSNAWNNNLPVPASMTGWSMWRSGSAGASGVRDSTITGVQSYIGDAGTSTAGGIYSYGAAGSSERALGSIGSTAGDFLIVLALKNTTSVTMTEFTLGWDLEQWRNGGNATAHSLIFDYRVSSSSTLAFSDTDASVTAGFVSPGGAFNGTGPIATTTAAAVVGNTAGLQAGRGGTITGISWAPNTTLILRWWDDNNTGSDHGLAIDNFTFRAVPEPSAIAALGLGVAALVKRRRKN